MNMNAQAGNPSSAGEMYLVEGPDGQMYGPTEASTILRWLAEGRLNVTTPLIEQATGNRITVSKVPGFVPFSRPNWFSLPITDPAPPKSSSPTWTIYAILAIFGFLFYGVFIVPKVSSGRGTAKVAAAHSDLATLSEAIQEFRLDCHRYPTQDEGLGALRTAPSGTPGWKGPYLTKKVPRDPWANDYVYRIPGPRGADYAVETYDRDGLRRGEGESAHIVVTN